MPQACSTLLFLRFIGVPIRPLKIQHSLFKPNQHSATLSHTVKIFIANNNSICQKSVSILELCSLVHLLVHLRRALILFSLMYLICRVIFEFPSTNLRLIREPIHRSSNLFLAASSSVGIIPKDFAVMGFIFISLVSFTVLHLIVCCSTSKLSATKPSACFNTLWALHKFLEIHLSSFCVVIAKCILLLFNLLPTRCLYLSLATPLLSADRVRLDFAPVPVATSISMSCEQRRPPCVTSVRFLVV